MRSALAKVQGVDRVDIDNSAKTATVWLAEGATVTPADLVAIFAGTRFSAEVVGG